MKGKSWKWFEQMAVGQKDNTKKKKLAGLGEWKAGEKN